MKVAHIAFLCGAVSAGAATVDYNAGGLRVRIGDPIEVTRTIGRAWFPTIARFSTGELLVTYVLTEDSNTPGLISSGFQVSKDGGKSWGHRYDVLPEFGSTTLYPKPDGTIDMFPHIFYRLSPNDGRNFHALSTRFEKGGRRVVMETEGVRIIDWPWAPDVIPNKTPRSQWLSHIRFDGNVIPTAHGLVVVGYSKKPGDRLYTVFAAASRDEGRTWRYLSTVADGAMMAGKENNPRAEGPNEAALLQLRNGDLMCVFRTGNGHLNLGRAYSKDGGRSWSKPEWLDAVGVEPSLARTAGGMIALTTGRPKLHLWLSADDLGVEWQHIDLQEHHNRWAPNESYKLVDDTVIRQNGKRQTTAYTEIIEVSPNRLLLVYDRTPNGWEPATAESGQYSSIFVLRIEVERR